MRSTDACRCDGLRRHRRLTQILGQTQVTDVDSDAQLAANAAYRDKLSFWFPARHPATITYKGRSPADGADFDVVGITPKGGREFELWVNVETKMIERLVEHEAIATRTEIYMDWRDVQGVKIPFRVRATRSKADEIVVIEQIEFDGPLAGVTFSRPATPTPAAVARVSKVGRFPCRRRLTTKPRGNR
jgi:hypothetical protein